MTSRATPAPKPLESVVVAAVGMAACAIEAQAAVGGSVQIFPMGAFRANDGRPADAGAWRMTPQIAARIAATAASRGTDTSFDYEHQTLRAVQNGKPAPAAGWFSKLEVRDDGIWATDIKWTPAARQMIESGEYRYASPVFTYDPKTGEVGNLVNVALTNTPAIDGMDAVAASAIAALSLITPTEKTMEQLLERLRALLNLPVTATPEEIVAHLDRLKASIGERAAAASFSLVDHVAALTQDLASTKTALAAASSGVGTPDPAKFVPMELFVTTQNQVAALSRQYESDQRTELLEAGLADGRILPAQKDYWSAQPIAALSAYLKVAQPMAALSRMQSGDGAAARDGGAAGALTDDQLKIARNLGVDPEKLAKGLAAQA